MLREDSEFAWEAGNAPPLFCLPCPSLFSACIYHLWYILPMFKKTLWIICNILLMFWDIVCAFLGFWELCKTILGVNISTLHEICCNLITDPHIFVYLNMYIWGWIQTFVYLHVHLLYMWLDIMQLLTRHWSPYLLPHQSRHVMVTPSTECHIMRIFPISGSNIWSENSILCSRYLVTIYGRKIWS